jgi:hypothetical protein
MFWSFTPLLHVIEYGVEPPVIVKYILPSLLSGVEELIE